MPLIEYATQITRQLAGSPLDPAEFYDKDASDARFVNLLETGTYNVLYYGAVGDGATDDTTAIQAAATAAAARAAATSNATATLLFPPGYVFKTTGQVTVGVGVNVQMDAPIFYYGTGICLEIGAEGTANQYLHLKVQVRRATIAAWADETQIGVRLINAKRCTIDLPMVRFFSIGVLCYATPESGFVYNNINVGTISDNGVGIDLVSADAVGWVNENLFLGGSFSISSSGPAAASGANANYLACGVRIGNDGLYRCNKNHFLKPSFEMNYAAMLTNSRAVRIIGGQDNVFVDCRIEDSGVVPSDRPVLHIAANANNVRNVFMLGYGGITFRIEDLSGSGNNFVYRDTPLAYGSYPLFDSGDIARRARHYNGSTSISVPGMFGITAGGAPQPYVTGTIQDGYLSIGSTSSGLGVMVDTSVCKRFRVAVDALTNLGTIAVVCFDAAGDILSGDAASHVAGSFSTSATFGGSYSATQGNSAVTIGFTDAVKSAIIGVRGSIYLRRLQVVAVHHLFGLPGDVATLARTIEVYPLLPLGLAAPLSNTWYVGDRVYNAAPSAGGTEGWICVEAGTPGTWKAFGVIAA